ncbi:MAG: PilZ domain-containing protein [Thermodesulfobacteriota bacterium]|nr:PilZ domain-containing protein [Thermodesulfobacteriota bacterium]
MEVQEQRKFERFDLSIPVKIEVGGSGQGGGKRILNHRTKDICAGGAYVHTAQPLPKGTEVNIDFVINIDKLKKITRNKAHVMVKGRVLRSESEGMAICFFEKYKMTSC